MLWSNESTFKFVLGNNGWNSSGLKRTILQQSYATALHTLKEYRYQASLHAVQPCLPLKMYGTLWSAKKKWKPQTMEQFRMYLKQAKKEKKNPLSILQQRRLQLSYTYWVLLEADVTLVIYLKHAFMQGFRHQNQTWCIYSQKKNKANH